MNSCCPAGTIRGEIPTHADLPLARSAGLIVEELDGGLLIYDGTSNLAHALDAEAAAVWRACDGRLDIQALVARCSVDAGRVGERWLA